MPIARIALAALLVIACSGAAHAQAGPPDRARQLSHAAIYDPSPSPDGTRLVYIMQVAGVEQLFTMDTAGRHIVQLTHDAANHEDPAWSPDGRTIAFVYIKDSVEVIAMMDADGQHVREVTPRTTRAIHPSWSADGRSLAYCTDDDLAPPRKNDADIMVLDVASGRSRVLITGGVNTYPVWSPSGRQIAFRRMIGQRDSEVFVANADGTGAHNLSNDPAFDGWPDWSPDEREIAFASNRADGKNYQIFVMNADGSAVRRVSSEEGRGAAPKWSRDGRVIFYSVCRRSEGGPDCAIFSVTP